MATLPPVPRKTWTELAAELPLMEGLWRAVRNRGCPGVDGVEVRDLATGKESDKVIRALRTELRSGRYEPQPYRLIIAETRTGEKAKRRQLWVAAARDRVLACATAIWLSRQWGPHMDAASFGYRECLGVPHALAGLTELVRGQGHRWVLDADIADFFGSVPLDRLAAQVAGLCGGARSNATFALLERFWRAPGWDGTTVLPWTRGVKQGCPLSPLSANLYLDPLDRALRTEGLDAVRYADDFVVLTHRRAQAEAARAICARQLDRLALQLHPDKTSVCEFNAGFAFLGHTWSGRTWRLTTPERERRLVFVAHTFRGR